MKLLTVFKRLNGATILLFRGQDVPDKHANTTLALSRAGGSCATPLATLQDHDLHSPAWVSVIDKDMEQEIPEEKRIDALPTYVTRIIGDAISIVGEPKVMQVCTVDDEGVIQEKTAKPFKALANAVGYAKDAEGHQAIIVEW